VNPFGGVVHQGGVVEGDPEDDPWKGAPPDLDPGGCRLYNSVLEMMPSKPPCRILPVAGRDVGMVALRRLQPGELIVEEAALVYVPDRLDREATRRLLEEVVGRMTRVQRDVFLALTDCRNPGHPDYLGRFFTNAMSYGEDAGLWPILARANHSCRPNAEFVTRKDLGLQHLRAIYPIEEGEEVEINYMLMEQEGLEGREARQEYLRGCYDFECICRACTLKGGKLEAEEGLRRGLVAMKDRGLGRLTEQEVQVYLAGLYTIQAKLSYIFEVVEEVFLASTGAASRAEFGRHGRALVALMYGEDSPQVQLWEERARSEGCDAIIDWSEGRVVE